MPPPLLFSSTMTMEGPGASGEPSSAPWRPFFAGPCSFRISRWSASAFRSCSMVKSPVRNVVCAKCWAAPMAVDTTPSMPFCPRLAKTAMGLPSFR